MKLLAIETSCDETAVAVFDLDQFLRDPSSAGTALLADIVSSQIKLHAPYGGVVPELAAREHIVNLPLILQEALETAHSGPADIAAVGVTRGPGLKGCLLTGLCFAKAFCFARQIPLYPINHLEGHLYSSLLLSPESHPQHPFLALLVSGGHTLLVFVEGFRRYRIVAQTRDDAAGEAFDKIASLLDLPYPGGPALSALATEGDPQSFAFPLGLANDPASFSFSGLKTAVLRKVQELRKGGALTDQARKDLAASAEQAIVRSLVQKTMQACRELRPKGLIVSGGVAANRVLRTALADEAAARNIPFCAPPLRWCTDNASMIAVAAALAVQQDTEAFERWRQNPEPGTLGPGISAHISAECRWPIDRML